MRIVLPSGEKNVKRTEKKEKESKAKQRKGKFLQLKKDQEKKKEAGTYF